VTPTSIFNATSDAGNTFTMEGNNAAYQMMNHNLGWVAATTRTYHSRWVRITFRQAETDEIKTFVVSQKGHSESNPLSQDTAGRNPYYQWGRKDPMLPAQTSSNDLKLLGAPYGYGPHPWEWEKTGIIPSYADAIKNPNKFYGLGVADNYPGAGTTKKDLWDAGNTIESLVISAKTTSVKTVYDPSPVGYKVPVADFFSALDGYDLNFTYHDLDGRYEGRDYKNDSGTQLSFFPASGYRRSDNPADNGSVTDLDYGIQKGYYWTSQPTNTDGAMALSFSANSQYTEGGNTRRVNAYAIRPVKDEVPAELVQRGILAPPGVIGYYAANGTDNGETVAKNQLTLAGDPSLRTPAVSGAPAVYAAYFKWSSLVAISSNIKDDMARNTDNGDVNSAPAFSYRDIIAAPNDYAGPNGIRGLAGVIAEVNGNDMATGQIAWGRVPFDEGGVAWSDAISSGLGNPCKYYFPGQDWLIPTTADYEALVGRVGKSENGSGYYLWTSNGQNADSPGYGILPQGNEQDAKIYALGYRTHLNGEVQHSTQGISGYYWSVIPIPSNNNVGGALRLNEFSERYVHTGEALQRTAATTIRCIQPPGVKAPAGVIGYYVNGPDKGKLTLAGDRSFGQGGTGTAYVAYFKWGSLVATGSRDKGDFSTDDIVAAPAHYHNAGATTAGTSAATLDEIKNLVDRSGPDPDNMWEAVPWDESGTGSNKWLGNNTDGLGDPCGYYFNGYNGENWMVPSHDDNNFIIGTMVQGVSEPSVTNPVWMLKNSARVLPAAGYRDGNAAGLVRQHGTQGQYWSSNSAPTIGYWLQFDTGAITYTEGDITSARAVRCVPYSIRATAAIVPGSLVFYGSDGNNVTKTAEITATDENGVSVTPTNYDVTGTGNWSVNIPNNTLTVSVSPPGTNITATSEPRGIEVTITPKRAGYTFNTLTLRCLQNDAVEPPAGEFAIGDVLWSGSNLIDDNSFATNATDATKLFRWGTKEAVDSNTQFEAPGYSPSATWTLENDPCPEGWHLPTETELSALANRMVWDTQRTGATVSGMPPDFFFPAAGYSSGQNGNARDYGVAGYYWSVNGSNGTNKQATARALKFLRNGNTTTSSIIDEMKLSGLCVRCVRAKDDI
jgi:uncharacterized protein (TIGR02145 family)